MLFNNKAYGRMPSKRLVSYIVLESKTRRPGINLNSHLKIMKKKINCCKILAATDGHSDIAVGVVWFSSIHLKCEHALPVF